MQYVTCNEVWYLECFIFFLSNLFGLNQIHGTVLRQEFCVCAFEQNLTLENELMLFIVG